MLFCTLFLPPVIELALALCVSVSVSICFIWLFVWLFVRLFVWLFEWLFVWLCHFWEKVLLAWLKWDEWTTLASFVWALLQQMKLYRRTCSVDELAIPSCKLKNSSWLFSVMNMEQQSWATVALLLIIGSHCSFSVCRNWELNVEQQVQTPPRQRKWLEVPPKSHCCLREASHQDTLYHPYF